MFHKPITALNRRGEEVSFVEIVSGKDLLDNISSTLESWKDKYGKIAIIHKDETKSTMLTKYLQDAYKIDCAYISLNEEFRDQQISVIASYNCKGMEFDAVILVNVNSEDFPKDELHARLLYVLLTRAQQEVKVFYQDTPSALLEGFIKESPVAVSVFDDIL